MAQPEMLEKKYQGGTISILNEGENYIVEATDNNGVTTFSEVNSRFISIDEALGQALESIGEVPPKELPKKWKDLEPFGFVSDGIGGEPEYDKSNDEPANYAGADGHSVAG